MSDWLAEWVNVVEPMLPMFADTLKEGRHRHSEMHKIGLINMAIGLQQYIIMGKHIEKTEGAISVKRTSELVAEMLHQNADRIVYMSMLDTDMLEVVNGAMYPVVEKMLNSIGIDFEKGGHGK